MREHGKIVIGCAYENQTNNVLAAVCDYFIRLNPGRNKNQTSNCIRSTLTVELQAVLDYLKANEPYSDQLIKDGISLSELKPIFTEKIPDFNMMMKGFSKFKTFLNSIIIGTDLETVCLRNGNKTKSVLRIKKKINNSDKSNLAAS